MTTMQSNRNGMGYLMHVKPKTRKYAHNAISLLLVMVLAVWQTPAAAFAGPVEDVDAGETLVVTTQDAADEAADEPAPVVVEQAELEPEAPAEDVQEAEAPADVAAPEADVEEPEASAEPPVGDAGDQAAEPAPADPDTPEATADEQVDEEADSADEEELQEEADEEVDDSKYYLNNLVHTLDVKGDYTTNDNGDLVVTEGTTYTLDITFAENGKSWGQLPEADSPRPLVYTIPALFNVLPTYKDDSQVLLLKAGPNEEDVKVRAEFELTGKSDHELVVKIDSSDEHASRILEAENATFTLRLEGAFIDGGNLRSFVGKKSEDRERIDRGIVLVGEEQPEEELDEDIAEPAVEVAAERALQMRAGAPAAQLETSASPLQITDYGIWLDKQRVDGDYAEQWCIDHGVEKPSVKQGQDLMLTFTWRITNNGDLSKSLVANFGQIDGIAIEATSGDLVFGGNKIGTYSVDAGEGALIIDLDDPEALAEQSNIHGGVILNGIVDIDSSMKEPDHKDWELKFGEAVVPVEYRNVGEHSFSKEGSHLSTIETEDGDVSGINYAISFMQREIMTGTTIRDTVDSRTALIPDSIVVTCITYGDDDTVSSEEDITNSESISVIATEESFEIALPDSDSKAVKREYRISYSAKLKPEAGSLMGEDLTNVAYLNYIDENGEEVEESDDAVTPLRKLAFSKSAKLLEATSKYPYVYAPSGPNGRAYYPVLWTLTIKPNDYADILAAGAPVSLTDVLGDTLGDSSTESWFGLLNLVATNDGSFHDWYSKAWNGLDNEKYSPSWYGYFKPARGTNGEDPEPAKTYSDFHWYEINGGGVKSYKGVVFSSDLEVAKAMANTVKLFSSNGTASSSAIATGDQNTAYELTTDDFTYNEKDGTYSFSYLVFEPAKSGADAHFTNHVKGTVSDVEVEADADVRVQLLDEGFIVKGIDYLYGETTGSDAGNNTLNYGEERIGIDEDKSSVQFNVGLDLGEIKAVASKITSIAYTDIINSTYSNVKDNKTGSSGPLASVDLSSVRLDLWKNGFNDDALKALDDAEAALYSFLKEKGYPSGAAGAEFGELVTAYSKALSSAISDGYLGSINYEELKNLGAEITYSGGVLKVVVPTEKSIPMNYNRSVSSIVPDKNGVYKPVFSRGGGKSHSLNAMANQNYSLVLHYSAALSDAAIAGLNSGNPQTVTNGAKVEFNPKDTNPPVPAGYVNAVVSLVKDLPDGTPVKIPLDKTHPASTVRFNDGTVLNLEDTREIEGATYKTSVGWKITANVGRSIVPGTITLTDTLPSGLSFADLEDENNFYAFRDTRSAGTSSAAVKLDPGWYTVSLDRDAGIMTISINYSQEVVDVVEKARTAGSNDYYFGFYFKTLLDGDIASSSYGGRASYKNTLEGTYTGVDGDLAPKWATYNQTQPKVITKAATDEEGAVTGEPVMDADGSVHAFYSIRVNPYAADLNAEGDTVLVKDTMSDVMVLDRDSVSAVDEEGNELTITAQQDGNVVSFEVPDEQYVTIRYRVDFNLNLHESPDPTWMRAENTKNSVELFVGGSTSSAGDSMDFAQYKSSSQAWASMENGSVTLKKFYRDADGEAQSLAGAKFKLTSVLDNYGAKAVDYGEVTVDENGTYVISNLPFDRVYKLVEETAPSGYAKSSDPVYFVIEGFDFQSIDWDEADELSGQTVMVFNADGDVSDETGTVVLEAQDDAILEVENIAATKVKVHKEWVGGKADSVTVHLYADDDAVEGKDAELSESNGWTYTFEGLPKYKDEGGSLTDIVYAVEEDPVSGFEASQSTTVLQEGKEDVGTEINLVNTKMTSISGEKVWKDGNGESRPSADDVTLVLKADEEVVEGAVPLWTNTAAANSVWYWTFEGLPLLNSDGDAISYSVEEILPAGSAYQVTYGETASGAPQITNTLTGTIDISGAKTWVDGGKSHDNAAEVALSLTRTSAKPDSAAEDVEAVPSWSGNTYTYAGLPKYDAEGYEYAYAVSEAGLEGYDAVRDGYDFTNTITGTVDVSGTKTWVDGGKSHDNAAEVALSLTRTSAKDGSVSERVDATPAWEGDTYTYSELPKYDAEGYEYAYAVSEAGLEGYDAARDGYDFTNSISDLGDTVDVSGTKTWVDGGKSHDNAAEVALSLTRTSAKDGSVSEPVDATPAWEGDTYTYSELPKYDAEGYEYAYAVSEAGLEGYDAARDGYDFTNTITGTVDVSGAKTWVDGGKSHDNAAEVALSLTRTSAKPDSAAEDVEAVPSWSGNTYTYAGLPKYDAEGYEYAYAVSEAGLEGYDAVRDGYDFTNTITGTVDVSGTKTWVDGGKSHDNAAEVALSLTRTSAKDGSVSEHVDATPAWEGDTYTYSELPKYDAEGYEYAYSVDELASEDYFVAKQEDGRSFINTIKTIGDTVNVSGTKTWVDGGKSHDNAVDVELSLTRTSAKDGSVAEPVDATPSWSGNTYTYTELPKYDAEGYEYSYAVSEAGLEGYDAAQDGYDFTNSISDLGDTVDVSGTKTWVDGGKSHDNASEVMLLLTRKSDKEGSVEQVVSAEVKWEGSTYTFSDLPKYDAEGYLFDYKVTEEAVEGYSSSQNGNDFRNTLLTSAKVHKEWIAEEDAVPAELEVKLVASVDNVPLEVEGVYAGESYATGATLILSAASGWNAAVTDLPGYDPEGREISYSWEELVPDGFFQVENSVDAEDSTETRIVNMQTTSAAVEKVWLDNEDARMERPAELAVRLQQVTFDEAGSERLVDAKAADGSELAVVALTAADNWRAEVTGLPKYDADGDAISYRWLETSELPHGYRLVSEVTEYNEEANATLTTLTNALAATDFEFTKYYYGGAESQEFAFQAIAVDENLQPLAGAEPLESSVTVGSNSSAQLKFADVILPPAGAEVSDATDDAPEVYRFLVSEKPAAGIIVDEAQYLVEVTVEDGLVAQQQYFLLYPDEEGDVDIDGAAYAKAATPDTAPAFFNNDEDEFNLGMMFGSLSALGYTVDGAVASVYPEVQKYLNDDTAMLVGDDFDFRLQGNGIDVTASNDGTGKVAFFDRSGDGLTFDAPGTYTYTISEVAGDDEDIQYDAEDITLTVTVEGDGEGALSAKATYTKDGADVTDNPAFYNSQEGFDLQVYKRSRYGGEGLDECTYALWMVGPNGDVMLQEATSDATGLIVFTDVVISPAHKYYFKEVEAPDGHTVDPYRTAYFTLNEAGTGTVVIEETADDGWHSKYDNIDLDREKGLVG